MKRIIKSSRGSRKIMSSTSAGDAAKILEDLLVDVETRHNYSISETDMDVLYDATTILYNMQSQTGEYDRLAACQDSE